MIPGVEIHRAAFEIKDHAGRYVGCVVRIHDLPSWRTKSGRAFHVRAHASRDGVDYGPERVSDFFETLEEARARAEAYIASAHDRAKVRVRAGRWKRTLGAAQ